MKKAKEGEADELDRKLLLKTKDHEFKNELLTIFIEVRQDMRSSLEEQFNLQKENIKATLDSVTFNDLLKKLKYEETVKNY